MTDIINSKDRERAGITAPPQGLCLKGGVLLMKNDDEINESSISDLIHYAEDEKRNTFDDEPETDDELDDEITETDDETVSDKEEPVSEEVSEENKNRRRTCFGRSR